MAKDWEKLAGETGEEVPSGRLTRMLQLGKMGAKVGVSMLASKAQSLIGPGDDELRHDKLQQAYQANAKQVVEVLGRLKGASMKIGQILSADPELVPEGFGAELSALQSAAPPMTYATVRAQIERALDRPIEVVFHTFEPEPIGAASIGQVHRGVLDDGREVAIKVQYPGVLDALESDLRSLGAMLTYGRAVFDRERLDAYLSEVRRIVIEEADYVREAETMSRFVDLLAPREGIRAPAPIMEWTRDSVLVMEYVEGTKLDVALEAIGPGPRRERLIERWVATYSWMFHEAFELHADPHPGNFLLEPDDTLAMLDFGSVKRYEPSFADGILDILDCCWQDEPARVLEVYARMGFGGDSFDPRRLDPELLVDYHRIVLAPFLRDEPFAFAGWSPALEGKAYMLKHPQMLKLAPPADALPYFRMLSGVKGLLAKFDARINVCAMAVETARRRGRLSDEPIFLP